MDLPTPGSPGTVARPSLAPRLGAPARDAAGRLTEMARAVRQVERGADPATVIGSPEQGIRLNYTHALSHEIAARSGMPHETLLRSVEAARSPQELLDGLAEAVARRQDIAGPPGAAHRATVASIADHLAAALSAAPDAEAVTRSYVNRGVPALAALDNAISRQQMVLGREPWLEAMAGARGGNGVVWAADAHPITQRFGDMPGYRALGSALDQWGSYPGEQLEGVRALARGESPALPETTRTLVHVLRDAPHVTPALHRGIAVPGTVADAAAQFALGSEHLWPITSWSEDPGQGLYFARRNVSGTGEERTAVLFELEPGARGFNTQAMSWRADTEQEWLMSGGFQVSDVRIGSDGVHVKLRQSQAADVLIPEA